MYFPTINMKIRRGRMKKALIVTAIVLLLYPFIADADDSDLFLFAVEPNVLIVLDGSGSMNSNTVPGFTGGDIDGYGNINTRMDVAYYVLEDLLDAENDNDIDADDEMILNVQFGFLAFHSSKFSGARGDVPDLSLETLNTCGSNLSSKGYLRWKNQVGSPYSDIWSSIRSVRATGWTPLAASLDQARTEIFPDYLQEFPDELCRNHYVIVITDGDDTCHNPIDDRAQAPIDAAAALYNNGAPNGQNFYAKVFVIGMGGVNETLRNTLNGMAKFGGTDANNDGDNDPTTGDTAYFTDSAEELAAALKDALTEIQGESMTFTNPIIPGIRSAAYDRTLVANFRPSDRNASWEGHLQAYLINEEGEIVDINGNPGMDENGKIIIDPLWDAGQRLSVSSPQQRTVYTAKSDGSGGWNREGFLSDNANLDPIDFGWNPGDIQKMQNTINWVLGVDTLDEDNDGVTNESRKWKLGDIFHSTPLVVGHPSPTFSDIGYLSPHPSENTTFFEEYKDRKQLIFVGANDGMLHAFHGGTWSEQEESYSLGTGMEEWAFIPNNLLEDLKSMPYQHGTYVDSSPKAVDYWVDANSDYEKQWSEWHTIVVTGQRGTHPYYFALDITNPDSATYPELKWEFTDLLAMGGSWSEPIFGRVKKKDTNNPDGSDYTEQWVMFVGGGYKENNQTGNSFFVVDLNTGDKIWEYTYQDNVYDHALMTYSIPSTVAAVDRDNDGFTDTVFVGDLGGQIWKFEMFEPGDDNDADGIYDTWEGQLFFHTLDTSQTIFYPPSLVFDSSHRLWIYFGTGNRLSPKLTTSQDRFYGIVDLNLDYALNDDHLKDVTNTAETSPFSENFRGWYYNLAPGEKVLARNTVFKGILYFTTFDPNTTSDVCATIGGDAKLYAMDYLTGDGSYDRNDDGEVTMDDRAVSIGSGIPSAPSLSLSGLRKGHKVIVDTTPGDHHVENIGGLAGEQDIIGIDSWAEF